MGNRIRIIVNEVEAVVPEHDLPKLPVARVLWVPQPNLKVGAAAWILAGGAHHTVYSQPLDTRYIEMYVCVSSATALTGLRVLSFAGCFPLSWRPAGSLRLFHRRQGAESLAKIVGWIDAEFAAGFDEAVDNGAGLA